MAAARLEISVWSKHLCLLYSTAPQTWLRRMLPGMGAAWLRDIVDSSVFHWFSTSHAWVRAVFLFSWASRTGNLKQWEFSRFVSLMSVCSAAALFGLCFYSVAILLLQQLDVLWAIMNVSFCLISSSLLSIPQSVFCIFVLLQRSELLLQSRHPPCCQIITWCCVSAWQGKSLGCKTRGSPGQDGVGAKQ